MGSNPIRVVCMKSLMQHLLPAYVVLFQCMLQKRDLSSAGRASALQAEGHRFEPCRSHLTNSFISYADVAQLAEQLICNQQVIGSSPIIGFALNIWMGSRVAKGGRL